MQRIIIPMFCAAAVLGCGGGPNRFPVHPVRGEVTVNGKPADGAQVCFHPAAEVGNPRAMRSSAVVGADGSFRAGTYLSADGLPVGEYVVTVTWPAPPKAAGDDEGPDRLRGAYSDPKKSTLRATVTAGENVLSPFHLN